MSTIVTVVCLEWIVLFLRYLADAIGRELVLGQCCEVALKLHSKRTQL